MKNDLYCGNCGKKGHNYKSCLAPIISLGIILVDRQTDTNKYLMIQRRDTLGFVEFMRGKYMITNINYIKKLFEIMTRKERYLILNNDFEDNINITLSNQNKTKKNKKNNDKRILTL